MSECIYIVRKRIDGKIAIFSLKHTHAHMLCVYIFWVLMYFLLLGLRNTDYTEIYVTKCKILY